MNYTHPRLIYFIKPVGMDGPIKIGCSSVPRKRLETLAVWSPFDIEILATAEGGYDMERKLHERFAYAHSHREWFNPVPELTAAIKKIACGAPVDEAVDLTKRTGSIRANIQRKPWTDERRRFMSWTIRIHAAIRRSERHFGCQMWAPEGVFHLAQKMQKAGFEPTAADVAYLESIIANPNEHCQNREQRWPRKVAA